MPERIVVRLCHARPSISRLVRSPQRIYSHSISTRATPPLASSLAPTYTELQHQPEDTMQWSHSRKPTSQSTLLARLPTKVVLRNYLLSFSYVTPGIADKGLRWLRRIANSDNALLNPDRNPIMRRIIRSLIYNHFCAGTNSTEVRDTVKSIKRLGYSGVILCYARETAGHGDANVVKATTSGASEIAQWANGTLETLTAMDAGDYLGLKFTGAGSDVTHALTKAQSPPTEFANALQTICAKASEKGCRIFVDAESQAVQHGIDQWSINLMRKWNVKGNIMIYCTIQAYLKASYQTLNTLLSLAQREEWSLGVKLVRGAYLGSDPRSCIHDNKAETDRCYDGIVHALLYANFPALKTPEPPSVGLFLATHNIASIRNATQLARVRADQGKLDIAPQFGQLQGMADEVGCELLEQRESLQRDSERSPVKAKSGYLSQTYKYLTWGSVQECMQYLVRRAEENRDAAERIALGRREFARELKRRFWTLL